MNIKELFPLKGTITQEIIDGSNIHCIRECIGANTLRAALREAGVMDRLDPADPIFWGRWGGDIMLVNKAVLRIETDIDMMEVTAPQEVIFTLSKEQS